MHITPQEITPVHTEQKAGRSPTAGTETSKEKFNIMYLKLGMAFHTNFKICSFIHYSEKSHL
jgi:hypothetical protein